MSAAHTPTPWMTQRCGELAPNDLMIVADLGKRPDGVQLISTVAKAMSIRQTPEDTKANAEFIVRCVNAHDELVAALKPLVAFYERHFVGGKWHDHENHWVSFGGLNVGDLRRAAESLAKAEAQS